MPDALSESNPPAAIASGEHCSSLVSWLRVIGSSLAHVFEEHDTEGIPRSASVFGFVQAGVALGHAFDKVGAAVAFTHAHGI